MALKAETPEAISAFLKVPTPAEWVVRAVNELPTMLIDHANCELKAASTAMAMIYRYPERAVLCDRMSRLAREELRHFEQVLAIMNKRGVDYPQLPASRYAGELHKLVRKTEPGRLVDTLIVGALIEARSCERFAALIPHLDEELADFYHSLLRSESRHFKDYLQLARSLGGAQAVDQRLPVFLAAERSLVQDIDSEVRFHSGPLRQVSPLSRAG